MLNKVKTSYYRFGAAVTMGALASSLSSTSANAATGTGGGNNFNSIAGNITNSIASLPGLVTALAYIFGVILAVLGVMKIKDHVENPSQTPLKDGAIRLAAGGALFALPIITDAMQTTIGTGNAVNTGLLNSITFTTN